LTRLPEEINLARKNFVLGGFMFKCLATAACFLSLRAVPAVAAQPDAAAVAAAERFLDSVDYDASVDQMIEQLSTQMKKQFAAEVNRKAGDPLPDDLMIKLQKIVDTHFRRILGDHRGDFKRATAVAYAARFTIPELNRLVVLESDPLLKKLRIETPELMVAGLSYGQELADADRPELESELKAAIQDYYATHGDSAATVSLPSDERPFHG
jgi:hypothetical protein